MLPCGFSAWMADRRIPTTQLALLHLVTDLSPCEFCSKAESDLGAYDSEFLMSYNLQVTGKKSAQCWRAVGCSGRLSGTLCPPTTWLPTGRASLTLNLCLWTQQQELCPATSCLQLHKLLSVPALWRTRSSSHILELGVMKGVPQFHQK